MEPKKVIERLLKEIAEQVASWPNENFRGIETGTHKVVIKLQKKKSSAKKATNLPDNLLDDLAKRLQTCQSREDGELLLASSLKNRKELELLARHLDVHVLKRDKVNQIRINIVEATIGAILRSDAIQGTKSNGRK